MTNLYTNPLLCPCAMEPAGCCPRYAAPQCSVSTVSSCARGLAFPLSPAERSAAQQDQPANKSYFHIYFPIGQSQFLILFNEYCWKISPAKIHIFNI